MFARIVKTLIIVAALSLLTPYFLGKIVDQHAAAFVANTEKNIIKNDKSTPQFKILSIQRGWFSSKILLEMTEKTEKHTNEVKTKSVIFHHGPFSFIDGHLMLGMGAVDIGSIQLQQSLVSHASAKIHIGFLGGWSAFLSITQEKVAELNGLKIIFPKTGVRVDCNANQTYCVFNVSGSHLSIVDIKKQTSIFLNQFHFAVRVKNINNQIPQLIMNANLSDLKTSNMHFAMDPVKHIPIWLVLKTDQLNLKNLHLLSLDEKEALVLLNKIKAFLESNNSIENEKAIKELEPEQKLISSMIAKDTSAEIKNFSLSMPGGNFTLNYKIAFPTLKPDDTFSDKIKNRMSTFTLNVPSWQYNDLKAHVGVIIYNLLLVNDIKQNMNMKVGALLAYPIDKTLMPEFSANKALALIKNFSFDSRQSDPALSTTSYSTQFKIDDACIYNYCMQDLSDRVELSDLSSNPLAMLKESLRKIADSKDKNAIKQNDYVQTILKVITPKTKKTLSHYVTTASGETKLVGTLSWPTWNDKTPLTTDSLLQKAVYTFQGILTEATIQAFLSEKTKETKKTSGSSLKEAISNAIQTGHLKLENGAYKMNLTGHGKEVIFH